MEQSLKNTDSFDEFVETHKDEIEKALQDHRPQAPSGIESEFEAAIDFVFSSNDTPIRPVLTLLGAELTDGKAEDLLSTAVAVEFVSYSAKIFDQLPFMRSDETSLKDESLDVKFGEDLAILVGLGFLNAAYPLVFVNHMGMPERAIQAHSEIVECVGAAGLVGGISVDGDDSSNAHGFDSSMSSKNSAFIRLALRLGAILSGADYIELANLSRFAEQLGDVYSLAQKAESSQITLESSADEAKRTLIENFPTNNARTCLIQLVDSLVVSKESKSN